MRFVRRLSAMVALAVLGVGAAVLPAVAVTGGEPDGNRHPNVGLILFYDVDGRFRCSATLISPKILITAAHCTEGTLGKTLVTFDSVIAKQPPAPFPVAADPSSGYTARQITSASSSSNSAVRKFFTRSSTNAAGTSQAPRAMTLASSCSTAWWRG